AWNDERKTTRKPLIAALSLTPDASDITIIQAAHEKASDLTKDGGGTRLDLGEADGRMMTTGPAKSDPGLFHAIEETVHLVLDRAKRLEQVGPKLEALAQQGRTLQPHVTDDFTHKSPGRAADVKQELSSSLDVLGEL